LPATGRGPRPASPYFRLFGGKGGAEGRVLRLLSLRGPPSQLVRYVSIVRGGLVLFAVEVEGEKHIHTESGSAHGEAQGGITIFHISSC